MQKPRFRSAEPLPKIKILPFPTSSGDMSSSFSPYNIFVFGSGISVSRSACRFAFSSRTIPTAVLIRIIKIKSMFFHAPAMARDRAIKRFSRLKTVQMFSFKIWGIVFVTLLMSVFAPDLYFHIVTRAKDGADWKNLNSSFNNIAKYCKKIYFMFDIARIYWYNYICGKSKGVTGRKYLFVLFFAQGRQMNAARDKGCLSLKAFLTLLDRLPGRSIKNANG